MKGKKGQATVTSNLIYAVLAGVIIIGLGAGAWYISVYTDYLDIFLPDSFKENVTSTAGVIEVARFNLNTGEAEYWDGNKGVVLGQSQEIEIAGKDFTGDGLSTEFTNLYFNRKADIAIGNDEAEILNYVVGQFRGFAFEYKGKRYLLEEDNDILRSSSGTFVSDEMKFPEVITWRDSIFVKSVESFGGAYCIKRVNDFLVVDLSEEVAKDVTC